MDYRTTEELEAGLPHLLASPRGEGRVELIARRPAVDEREILERAEVTVEGGLVGDRWRGRRGGSRVNQLTLMNSRAAALVAGPPERWALAGDQLYVDLDLSQAGLPDGTRLSIGEHVVIEMSSEPHTGCSKFMERFGKEALRFVNVGTGRELNLRGRNARVIIGGTIVRGDPIRVLAG